MPRPKKSIDEKIQQTREEIEICENKLSKLKQVLNELLAEKEEQERQSLIELIKERGLEYNDVRELIQKEFTK